MSVTNVDFFRSFAEDTTYKSDPYHFEHDRESLDFSNLFESTEQDEAALASDDDQQIKMFHFTSNNGIIPDINESGGFEGIRYRGEILVLKKSQIDEVIDVQKGVEKEDGKYEKRMKPLLDTTTGFFAEISEYNSCNLGYDLKFVSATEVYNWFDENMDGLWLKYDLYIRE
jgi:hypothetical protein